MTRTEQFSLDQASLTQGDADLLKIEPHRVSVGVLSSDQSRAAAYEGVQKLILQSLFCRQTVQVIGLTGAGAGISKGMRDL